MSVFYEIQPVLAKNIVYCFFHSVQHCASHDFTCTEQIKG